MDHKDDFMLICRSGMKRVEKTSFMNNFVKNFPFASVIRLKNNSLFKHLITFSLDKNNCNKNNKKMRGIEKLMKHKIS